MAGKALMKKVGVDCGVCRLPLKPLTGIEYKNFIKDLDNVVFFEIKNP